MSTTLHDDLLVLKYYQLGELQPDTWQCVEAEDDLIAPPSKDAGEEADPLHLLRYLYEERRAQVLKRKQLEQQQVEAQRRRPFQETADVESEKTDLEFIPKRFLARIHNKTTYNELRTGTVLLRRNLQQRSEGMKELVKTHFEQFVGAKNAVDAIHKSMEKQGITENELYGTKLIKKSLERVKTDSEDVFAPIMNRRQQGDRIRATLAVLERHRFLFNLPNTLADQAKQKKYDVVALQYKKGRDMVRTLRHTKQEQHELIEKQQMPAEEELGGEKPEEYWAHKDKDVKLAEARMEVFEQVWRGAESVIARVRTKLLEIIKEAWHPMELQEKHIAYLVELDSTDDPVWFYLQSQYGWINDMMKDAFESYRTRMDELKAELGQEPISGPVSAVARAGRLKKAIVINDPREFKTQFGKEVDVQIWEAVHSTTKVLCEILQRKLPGFWRVSQAYIDDRFYRRNDVDPTPAQTEQAQKRLVICQQMLRRIIQYFTDIISTMVGLPDRKALTSGGVPISRKPEFPVWSGTLTTSYFLGRMVGRISDCRLELRRADVHNEADARLAWLERETRKHCVAALCERWLEDSRVFHLHEDWQADVEDPKITGYTRLFQRFQRQILASVGRLLGEPAAGNKREDLRSKNALERAQHSFAWTTMAWLDTLFFLATRPQPEQDKLAEIAVVQRKIDINLTDFKLLNVLRNLAHLRDELLPSLADHAATCLIAEVTLQLNTLRDTVSRLQKRLIHEYVSRKLPPISASIREGVLESGTDWVSCPTPKEIRNYIHRSLLILVLIHGEVTSAAPAMTTEVLNLIQDRLSMSWLDAVRRLDKLGTGGLLQLQLESRFLRHSLRGHRTQVSENHYRLVEEVLQDIGTAVSMNPEDKERWLKAKFDVCVKDSFAQLLCFTGDDNKMMAAAAAATAGDSKSSITKKSFATTTTVGKSPSILATSSPSLKSSAASTSSVTPISVGSSVAITNGAAKPIINGVI